jgi:hypothetical protein
MAGRFSFLEAAKRFHKISGYRLMPDLAEALANRKSGLTRIKLHSIIIYGSPSNFNNGWDKAK